uniref:C2H2-type domain-containing protein n=1 Tax=Capitella teleta TaxID=283909 RepID=X1YTT0_CAPTE
MREHMNQHRGLQSYLCMHCGRMFSTQDSLIQHLRIHEGDQCRQFSCKTY